MPTEMSSWADEIDETDTSLVLPAPSEKWVGNQKITTEYTHNEDGKKVIIKLETSTGHLVWTVLGGQAVQFVVIPLPLSLLISYVLQQIKIIRTFKIEKKLVSKSVAKRKGWQKFGMSRNDRPGKNYIWNIFTLS